MLSIGEFSNLTGLSVTALRHYDEEGVLEPAVVDPRTGYRRYSPAQVRPGALVRVLRDAGLGLPDVVAALRDAAPDAALEQHRDAVAAQRRREDAAFSDARRILLAYATPAIVVERNCPAQPYVGRAVTMSVSVDADAANAAANDEFGRLFAELQRDGLGPCGGFWTELRPGDQPDHVQLICCWPTRSRAPQGWGGPQTIVDELPRRRELAASWTAPGDQPDLPDGAVHPAVLALFDAAADRQLDLDGERVRQTVTADGDTVSVEVAVTITRAMPD